MRRCPEAERPFRCFIRNGDGHLTLSCVTPEETNQCIKCDSDSPDTPAGPPWEPSLAFVLVVVSVAIVAVLFCCVRQHNNADKNCWLDSHTETVLSKSVSVRSRYDSCNHPSRDCSNPPVSFLTLLSCRCLDLAT